MGSVEDPERVRELRPAVAVVLRQQHRNGKWYMCACISRFLTETERRAVIKNTHYISSLGEALAMGFGLEKFHHWLMQLPAFEVLVDCKNLSWYRTSTSVICVELRDKLSRLYDLDKIKLRSISREGNVSDLFARLALEPEKSVFETLATITPLVYFGIEKFSEEEREQIESDDSFNILSDRVLKEGLVVVPGDSMGVSSCSGWSPFKEGHQGTSEWILFSTR